MYKECYDLHCYELLSKCNYVLKSDFDTKNKTKKGFQGSNFLISFDQNIKGRVASSMLFVLCYHLCTSNAGYVAFLILNTSRKCRTA